MFRAARVFWGVALLAIALALPSLFADFYADDQGMVLTLEGVARPPVPGPFQLYTFASGAPGERAAFVDGSRLPWWTVDRIRISFCRPLSSALLALDHALAGRRPLLYHVHSMAWYAAAALSAALLFQRLLPAREAALSALLFTVSPAHWMLSAWPSARHVAISGTFAILALLFQPGRDRTLEIGVSNGALLDEAFESLLRPANVPLHVGDVLPLGTWTIRILSENSGRPTRFSVRFDRSIDDPSIVLLIWRDGALRALTPPALGQELWVKHERGPMGI